MLKSAAPRPSRWPIQASAARHAPCPCSLCRPTADGSMPCMQANGPWPKIGAKGTAYFAVTACSTCLQQTWQAKGPSPRANALGLRAGQTKPLSCQQWTSATAGMACSLIVLLQAWLAASLNIPERCQGPKACTWPNRRMPAPAGVQGDTVHRTFMQALRWL